MLKGRGGPTAFRAVTAGRPPWLCKRCFHAQIRLLSEQSQSDPSSNNSSAGSSAGDDVPLSPIEAFRRKYIKPTRQAESPKEPSVPPSSAEIFNFNWASSEVTQNETPQSASKPLTLADLAAAYREQGAPREYSSKRLEKKDVDSIQDNMSKIAIGRRDLGELIQRDEMDILGENEIFGGENIRDYQGVLPLEGKEFVQEKFAVKLGSLVETRSVFGSTLGIIISDRYLESHRICYEVSPRGKIFLVRPQSAVFVLPDFAPLDKVKRIEEIIHQENDAPARPDRIPMSPKKNTDEWHKLLNAVALQLYQFKVDAQKELTELRRSGIDPYELLRDSDPSRTTSIFTPEAAKFLFKTDSPTHAQLYATHKLLADDKVHFITDVTRHIDTATFLVRALRDVDLNQQVVKWIRESSTQMQSFIQKSQKLITLSRSLPLQSVPAKIDVDIPEELHFNDSDRVIIDFIIGSITGRRGFMPDDISALMPSIIRQTGMYPAEVIANPDRNAAKLFLTEIGVWQPSESLPALTDAGQIVDAIFEEKPVTETFIDTNADIRHDFGEMPVYTIDDAGAHELDDGISIEGDWLHVHIANPSAFITPDSHVAELARLRMTTMYLPDDVRPMLPINNPDFNVNGFAKDLNEMPTMTFSARLGADGNITEYKVRAGIVRNVKILTYNDVNSAIFPDQESKYAAWWTPTYVRPDYKAMGKQFDTITPEIASQLRAIEDVIQKHRDWRIREGALRMKFPGASLQINPAPVPFPEDKSIPTFIRGQAGIEIRLNQQSSPSRSLIEEMMIIANRVAGLFAKEHDIPVAFRGLLTKIPTDVLERARSLHLSGTKELPESLSREILSTSGGWFLQQSPTPTSHDLLGLSADSGGYVQVTSPMRRYLDILAHWQFAAYLHGREMPFTHDDLSGTGEYSLIQASRRLFRRTFFSRRYNQYFSVHAVSQLLADPAAIGSTHLEFVDGTPVLTGFMMDPEILGTGYHMPRMIGVKELGVVGFLMLEPNERVPGFDEVFPVEILDASDAEGVVRFRKSARGRK